LYRRVILGAGGVEGRASVLDPSVPGALERSARADDSWTSNPLWMSPSSMAARWRREWWRRALAGAWLVIEDFINKSIVW